MYTKYNDFTKSINESGIRNIRNIIKGKKNAEIYFHMDMDGVTSAIAIKEYLKRYNINTINSHIVQYGEIEYGALKPEADNLAVLVDFAHGKCNFDIHLDHHLNQVGTDSEKSTKFKSARANADTISSEISYTDIFTSTDIELIKTVDSADFVKYDIKPEDLGKSIFKLDKDKSSERNRFMMGFVVNRLLLAYKNKNINVASYDGKTNYKNKNLLECVVLDADASLYSMYNILIYYINNSTTFSNRNGEVSLSTQEEIRDNLMKYVDTRKDYTTNRYDARDNGIFYDEENHIMMQYGAGNMMKPGSYERYTPFRNFPDANILITIWSMGLIQMSYNPFKKDIPNKVDLSTIKDKVLRIYKPRLYNYFIPVLDVKKQYETSKAYTKNKQIKIENEEGDISEFGFGFTFNDIKDNYGDKLVKQEFEADPKPFKIDDEFKTAIETDYDKLTDEQMNYLSSIKFRAYDLISTESGGHKEIMNLTGFSYLSYNKEAMRNNFNTGSYIVLLKRVAATIYNEIKKTIK